MANGTRTRVTFRSLFSIILAYYLAAAGGSRLKLALMPTTLPSLLLFGSVPLPLLMAPPSSPKKDQACPRSTGPPSSELEPAESGVGTGVALDYLKWLAPQDTCVLPQLGHSLSKSPATSP